MKVYKMKATSEPGVTVVVIREKKISEGVHRMLPTLSGDLFLIFSETLTKEINPRKFSNLYGATWYGVYKDDQIRGIWEALDYIEAITKYSSASIILNNFLLPKDYNDNLLKLQYSGIEKSVFSTTDLTRDEKAEIYTIKPKFIELALGVRFKFPGKNNDRGLYLKLTSKDPVIFLRPSEIREIREKLSPEILHSFYGLNPGSFFASLITPGNYVNVKINEAHV